MAITGTIRDPLGNRVHLSPEWNNDPQSVNQLKQIIAAPAFMITITNGPLYFIRKLSPRVNKLVEVKFSDAAYTVHNLIDNPTVEYISALLKKGRLISFL